MVDTTDERHHVDHGAHSDLFEKNERHNPQLQQGDRVPNAVLNEGKPDNKVHLHDVLKGKKVILFGVPGAYTPTCSDQLPGFVDRFDAAKQKGIEEIVCITVNDAFVAKAWSKDNKAEGKVRVLADPRAEWAKAAGLELQATPILGGTRLKRFAAIVDDERIKYIFVEPDGTGMTKSFVDDVLEEIK